MPKRQSVITAVAAAGIVGGTIFATMGSAQANGYSSSPTSRQMHCLQGNVDCGPLTEEDLLNIEGPSGFPEKGAGDGSICAGNNEIPILDAPIKGGWPTSKLKAGENHTFSWTNKDRPATSKYEYFITKDDWQPENGLQRRDLELEPFLTVPMDGKAPDAEESHEGKLPDKSGKQLILGVQTLEGTDRAFYSCADVEF